MISYPKVSHFDVGDLLLAIDVYWYVGELTFAMDVLLASIRLIFELLLRAVKPITSHSQPCFIFFDRGCMNHP